MPRRSFLVTRLVPIGDEWLLSGAASVLPAASSAEAHRAAAEIALQHPALALRDPERLAQGWELQVGDEVEVVGMASDKECQHEMFVRIRWERDTLAVPLSQLEGGAVDEQTRQAIDDWHYWAARYEL